jgi:membrane protein
MPWTARSLITEELTDLVQNPTGLTLGLVASLSLSLLSASSGVLALIRGVNIAYDEVETRGWIRLRFLAVGFTLGLSLFVLVAVGTITLLPTALHRIGLDDSARQAISILRWPFLAAAVMVGLAVLYRYGPNRTPPMWRWVTWGAVLATAFWTLVSFLFSLYAENLGRYNKTYGAFGGVVVLELWMYLSTWAILLGAELNAELEHQTAKDSTIGPERPMGERRAAMADSLGEARPPEEKSLGQRVKAIAYDWIRAGRRKRGVDEGH